MFELLLVECAKGSKMPPNMQTLPQDMWKCPIGASPMVKHAPKYEELSSKARLSTQTMESTSTSPSAQGLMHTEVVTNTHTSVGVVILQVFPF
jgi:hypothetical protein